MLFYYRSILTADVVWNYDSFSDDIWCPNLIAVNNVWMQLISIFEHVIDTLCLTYAFAALASFCHLSCAVCILTVVLVLLA